MFFKKHVLMVVFFSMIFVFSISEARSIKPRDIKGNYLLEAKLLNGIPFNVLGLPRTEVALSLMRDNLLNFTEPTNSPTSVAENDSELGVWRISDVSRDSIKLEMSWIATFVDPIDFLTPDGVCEGTQTCTEVIVAAASVDRDTGLMKVVVHVTIRGADGLSQPSPFYLAGQKYWSIELEGYKFEQDEANDYYHVNGIPAPVAP